MINVDSVYQKVLALANKEQRGYITPLEYNLFAVKAQKDIFDGYFHDLKTAYIKTKNDTNYSDEVDMIEEKLHRFVNHQNISAVVTENKTSSSETGKINLSYDNNQYNFYKLISIERDGKMVEEVKQRDLPLILNNPLTAPTKDRSIYVRLRDNLSVPVGVNNVQNNNNYYNLTIVQVYPTPITPANFAINFYRSPINPRWNYQMVLGNALYQPDYSKDFEIHSSDESILVDKILQLSGIAIQKPDLVQAGITNAVQTKQSQND